MEDTIKNLDSIITVWRCRKCGKIITNEDIKIQFTLGGMEMTVYFCSIACRIEYEYDGIITL